MLAPGTPAPDFTLPDHTGAAVSLASLLATGPAVLFFYPGDFTPACSKEACMFRDMHDLATSVGVQVAGINSAPPAIHAAFRSTFRLPFHLLSDRRKRVARAYDAVAWGGLMSRRITYVVAHDGVIQDAVEASLAIASHKDILNRAIQNARDQSPTSK